MFGISAALAAAVAQPAGAQFIDLFVSACMNGSAKFEKGAVREVTHKELPPVLRNEYRPWPNSKYYEILKPSRGYLITMRDERRKQSAAFYEICTVAAPALPFAYGYDHVRRLLRPDLPTREARPKFLLEFYDPETGIALGARTMASGWGSLKLARAGARYSVVPNDSGPIYVERAPKKVTAEGTRR